MHLAILGNGVFANVGALYLRRRLPPSVEISIIGPESRGGMPVVGEALIEISAQFLERKLGLGPYLRDNHNPKYGLTYYFKLDPDDPASRDYSVHCNERDPDDFPELDGGWHGPMARPPSWLLNREVFDRDMRRLVDETPGINRIFGLVGHVELSDHREHTIGVQLSGGGEQRLSAHWIMDATGRRTLLGKKLGLKLRSPLQRDCFWFRLSDFDRARLSELDAHGPTPPGPGERYHYDRYYTAHHFMGRGNWIWLLPLRSADNRELISIGISTRPDRFAGQIGTMDDFIRYVSKTHPVVADLVRTGRVEDTNVFRKFHYVSKQAYSKQRWALVGDSAFSPDALFSNGLAFGVLQLEQLGEMISKDCEGDHDPEFIERLDRAFWAPVVTSQQAIAEWYESMHDAFLSSLRLNMIEIAYFYGILPLTLNRAHYDPKMLPAWSALQIRQNGGERSPYDVPDRVREARMLFDKCRPEHFIYRGKVKVNPRAMVRANDVHELRSHLTAGHHLTREYVADAIAQVRLAEAQSTTRRPAIST
jgi:flavin-dependent dehydrogenase